MKNQFKYTPLALAVAALFAAPLAMAHDGGNDENGGRNTSSVTVKKEVDIQREVKIHGDPRVIGTIFVGSSSAAVTNQNQGNSGNDANDNIVDNNAKADGNALNGASGNIGLNITAGDNNYQDNSAALSAVDAKFVFADAESFSNQSIHGNTTNYTGTRNNASLGENALYGAKGNIAANISAGNNNLQANSLAASVNTSGTMAEANVVSNQMGGGNTTNSNGAYYTLYDTTKVSMSGGLTGGSFGYGYGGYSGTNSGGTTSATTQGTSVQNNNWYPDIWSSTSLHPCSNCVQTGHVDLDGSSQGARLNGKSDANGPIGGLGLDNTGTSTGTYSGSTSAGQLGFYEVSGIGLSGTFSGTVDHTYTVFRPHENNASLGGSALYGASGNIGVNIAAGSNNMQGNHLAIAAAMGGVSSPSTHPGE